MVPSSETTEKSGGSGKAIAFVLGILALIMIFKKSTAAAGATPESVPDTGNDAGGGVSGGGTSGGGSIVMPTPIPTPVPTPTPTPIPTPVPVPVSGLPLSIKISSPNDGLTVHFSAKVSGGTSPYRYKWDFGDGTTSTLAEVDHTYKPQGLPTDAMVASAIKHDWIIDDFGNLPHPRMSSPWIPAGKDARGRYQIGHRGPMIPWAEMLTYPDTNSSIPPIVLPSNVKMFNAMYERFKVMGAKPFKVGDAVSRSDRYIVGLAVLMGWAGGIYWSGKEQMLALLSNTFTGTVTLEVSDSTGTTAKVSETINVAKQ